jgi:hypothetical protein
MAKLSAFGFLMQLKRSHKDDNFDNNNNNNNNNHHSHVGGINRYSVITNSSEMCHDGDTENYVALNHTIDSTIRPVCLSNETLSNMLASDSPSSERSFLVHSNSNWRFYSESKEKYGWIMNITEDEVNKM